MKKTILLLCLLLILLPFCSCKQTPQEPTAAPETSETPAANAGTSEETDEPTETTASGETTAAKTSEPSTEEPLADGDARVKATHEGSALTVELSIGEQANKEVSLILLSDKSAIDTWLDADADKLIDLRQISLDASGNGGASMYLPEGASGYLFVTLGDERIVKEVG